MTPTWGFIFVLSLVAFWQGVWLIRMHGQLQRVRQKVMYIELGLATEVRIDPVVGKPVEPDVIKLRLGGLFPTKESMDGIDTEEKGSL